MSAPVVPVAIGGLGIVGRSVAERVVAGLPGYELTAVSAARESRAREYLDKIKSDAAIVPLTNLSSHADLVIESAPSEKFREIAEPVISSGKRLAVLSSGALLESWDLVEAAASTGAQILVPSGAILGLDAMQAAAEAEIFDVKMVTRKPMAGLHQAPLVVKRGIDLSKITEPTLIFQGSAREAITGFPANLNVAVALALAGIGPDRTILEVWADPGVDRNTHTVTVEASSARLEFSIANVPSENPKTGKITALSVVALLRKALSPLRVGT